MTPWLLITGLTAAINLSAFVLVRGRWDRLAAFLAVAALAGAGIGDLLGGRLGFSALRIGDYHFAAASIAAQLAMLATVLLAGLLPARRAEP
jgi:hypothetical protein